MKAAKMGAQYVTNPTWAGPQCPPPPFALNLRWVNPDRRLIWNDVREGWQMLGSESDWVAELVLFIKWWVYSIPYHDSWYIEKNLKHLFRIQYMK